MKTFTLVLALAVAPAIGGCGAMSLKGQMQNRATVTLDCDRGFLASLWGPFGFTTEVDGRDVQHWPCATRKPPVVAPATTLYTPGPNWGPVISTPAIQPR